MDTWTLPPCANHPWDEPAYREQIWKAAEAVWRAHYQGAGHQVGRYMRELKRLTEAAQVRQAAAMTAEVV